MADALNVSNRMIFACIVWHWSAIQTGIAMQPADRKVRSMLFIFASCDLAYIICYLAEIYQSLTGGKDR